MSHLADWFAGIDSPPPAPATPARHADNVAVLHGAAVDEVTLPDPLALIWCREYQQEMHGAVSDPSGLLPLLCRGCTGLAGGRCTLLAAVPDHDSTALCRRFAPRVGVKVGRCWLYRVALAGGRLVWWSSTPPVGQVEAIRRVRLLYGEAVQEVLPLPGWVVVPAV